MNPIRNHRKKGKKSANIWELEGGKATLPPEGSKVALPTSYKGEQEFAGMTRDIIGFQME